MPQNEREIGNRIRLFRQDETKLSQVAFARELGVDGMRLASYEHGRAMVRVWLAVELQRRFGVNLCWLAGSEKGPRFDLLPLHPESFRDVGADELFSEAFGRVLENRIRARREMASNVFKYFDEILRDAPSAAHAWHEVLSTFIASLIAKMPAKLLPDFQTAVSEAALSFWTKNKAEIEKGPPAYNGSGGAAQIMTWRDAQLEEFSKDKSSVDDTNAVMINISSMKASESLWDDLQERVVAATEREGAKKELAEFLGIGASAVSQLRGGGMKLDAEKTLRLLTWVAGEEAKGKPASAATPTPKRRAKAKP